jgi:hypothetical protein
MAGGNGEDEPIAAPVGGQQRQRAPGHGLVLAHAEDGMDGAV